ncbi:MAG: site-specific integrase [Bacteroidetes bacterium]|nr:site-specific integrase [Bacteroidota bacterium]
MIEKSLSILFYLKKSKNDKKASLPVYLRITVNGAVTEMTTKYNCDPERWNSQAQRARGTNETSRTLNMLLDTLERKVHETRIKLIEIEKEITAVAIKNALTGREEKKLMLLDFFKQHNERITALINSEFAPGTIERYNTAFDHTRNFIMWKYGKADIELKSLSFDFVTNFEFYLKSERKCSHNTTIKYISNLRKIVNHCVKSGWLHKDPFIGFKMTKKEVLRDYLTEDELKTIATKQFNTDRLDQIRDIFLFSCYTGLAYIDVFQLRQSNIGIGIDGNNWLFTKRQKTDIPSRIPLLPMAQTILEKYKDHPKCLSERKVLPTVSNQKMNAYLKEIGDICGFSKNLTFHIARHTFATTVTLSNGVPIETVSMMLGHKNIKMTQHYAKILDRKVSDDMKKLLAMPSMKISAPVYSKD